MLAKILTPPINTTIWSPKKGSIFYGYNTYMDKVTEVRLFVDRLEFVTEMLEKCLDFKRTSQSKKLITNLKMDSGTEIVLYDSREVYKEGDKVLKLTIIDSKIERLKEFLDSKGEKYFYKEKHEFGINRILYWQMDSGSMIDFCSEE